MVNLKCMTFQLGKELLDEDELLDVDPKTAISEALNNLSSAQMTSANAAIVALMALVQDTFNQKALAAKANSIFVGVIGKFKEVAELYASAQNGGQSMEIKDCEEYLRQASNFLLKFIPQPAVASNIDSELFELLTSSLLTLLPALEETNVSLTSPFYPNNILIDLDTTPKYSSPIQLHGRKLPSQYCPIECHQTDRKIH